MIFCRHNNTWKVEHFLKQKCERPINFSQICLQVAKIKVSPFKNKQPGFVLRQNIHHGTNQGKLAANSWCNTGFSSCVFFVVFLALTRIDSSAFCLLREAVLFIRDGRNIRSVSAEFYAFLASVSAKKARKMGTEKR